MKTGALILFISLVTVAYGLVNSYIFMRGLQAIPPGSPWRCWFSIIFWILASSFILARVLERIAPSHVTGLVTWTGSFWLGFLLFFFLAVVLIDLIRVLDSWFHFIPLPWLSQHVNIRIVLFYTVVASAILFVAAGFLNARIPRIRELDLTICKPNATPGEFTVVMVSDIHLGTIIAARKANRLVERINSLHPDLVLFAGDIVDEDLAPVIRYNLGEALSRIRSRLGNFGVTGNHEYIGGAGAAIRYLEGHGIRMLRDSVVKVNGSFFLAGRDDRDKQRFTGKPRKDLEEVIAGIDTSYPVLLLDHQPFNLAKSAGSGIDLHLSGHTHHGQVWPFNYLTGLIYELSWGYKRTGNTHFYVSCGYGTWGPPIRIGNRPEIVKILLRFTR
jgi:predicted MPP superfamily phosphohydrolase